MNPTTQQPPSAPSEVRSPLEDEYLTHFVPDEDIPPGRQFSGPTLAQEPIEPHLIAITVYGNDELELTF